MRIKAAFLNILTRRQTEVIDVKAEIKVFGLKLLFPFVEIAAGCAVGQTAGKTIEAVLFFQQKLLEVGIVNQRWQCIIFSVDVDFLEPCRLRLHGF